MDKNRGTGSTSLLSRNVTIDGEVQGDENLHGNPQTRGAIIVGTVRGSVQPIGHLGTRYDIVVIIVAEKIVHEIIRRARIMRPVP